MPTLPLPWCCRSIHLFPYVTYIQLRLFQESRHILHTILHRHSTSFYRIAQLLYRFALCGFHLIFGLVLSQPWNRKDKGGEVWFGHSGCLNRQLMMDWAALRSRTRAWTSLPRVSWSGIRCLRQERDSTLNSISAIPSTSSGQDSTNCRAWACSGTPAVSAIRRASTAGEGLVQRRRAVGVQVVQDHPYHWDLRIGFIHQPAHLMGEILHRAPLGHRHLPPASLAARRPETGCGCPPAGTRSPAAGCVPAGVASAPGSRPSNWAGGLVKADHRPLWVIGFGVQVQHILHVGHELGASPWGCTTLSFARA